MTSLALRVVGIDDLTSTIRSFSFAAADGAAALPTFVPGSHLVIDCGGRPNAYSLTGDAVHPATYSVSVLRAENGNGGSRWLHDRLRVGDVISAELPRSGFPPMSRATRHLLVAGGIGVTPILSHLRAAAEWGHDAHVLFVHRSGQAAHIEDLTRLGAGRVELFSDREGFRARLRVALTEQPLGTHLYVCGPGGMIDHVLETAAGCGWPGSRLHAERFGIDALDAGDPFTVSLTGTGSTVEVPSGTSLLEALEAAGLPIPNRCRQGVCGECRIPVATGTPLHRDLYLTDEEKTAGNALMCCVSRADGSRLELPL